MFARFFRTCFWRSVTNINSCRLGLLSQSLSASPHIRRWGTTLFAADSSSHFARIRDPMIHDPSQTVVVMHVLIIVLWGRGGYFIGRRWAFNGFGRWWHIMCRWRFLMLSFSFSDNEVVPLVLVKVSTLNVIVIHSAELLPLSCQCSLVHNWTVSRSCFVLVIYFFAVRKFEGKVSAARSLIIWGKEVQVGCLGSPVIWRLRGNCPLLTCLWLSWEHDFLNMILIKQ